MKRIGILTGGGDCPGLNAVIRAVTKAAIFDHALEVIGIEEGFGGLIRNLSRPLKAQDTSGILARGGTILGASNRDDPFAVPGPDGTLSDQSELAIQTIRNLKIDALVCVGGDGTMTIADRFQQKGVPIIGRA